MAGFREKPRAEQWVNGGFMVFEPGALAYLSDDVVLEREPLERLAADGALAAYRHEGLLALPGHVQGRRGAGGAVRLGAPPWLGEATAAG